ncbi:MAG: class II fructose-bisphosphate aldolase [Chloroflexi bacterium]|nr:class II fructose-bisphosphate aldolase [Chloroflexota bacterium]
MHQTDVSGLQGTREATSIDTLVWDAVFAADEQARESSRRTIRERAASQGIHLASIQGLYDAAGKGLYCNRTVPAINIRGINYMVARAVFRAAIKRKAGAFIFEIARSEIGYTAQRPAEYVACVLAAGLKEGFRGPVFVQGDHYQANRKRHAAEPEKELDDLKALIRESIDAGFLNIDIDASTLVDLDKPTLEKQQEKNCEVTADLTRLIRSVQPGGVTVSVGGEIGEVGKRNSTVEDLRVFMAGYLRRLGPGAPGISKISVQTGTTHGGVVLPDGSIARVKIDFKALEDISKVAREEYGMAGAVQHGASTLPDEAFDMFPRVGAAEVHLATGFQNMIYDSAYFPKALLDRINKHLTEHYANEREPKDTEDQFLYKTRKKALGDFKRELWDLPRESLEAIGQELEDRFALLFQKLNVVDTVELVERYVVGKAKT